jgi:hypothetical protein
MLARYKGRATCCTALFTVVIRKPYALRGNSINIRRSVCHHAIVIGADIEPTNIITPDHKNVGFL